MSETLQIARSGADGKVAFTLAGEFTIYAAAEVHALIGEALGSAIHIRIDLSGVSEFDSSALQILRAAAREATERGVALEVVGHPPALQSVMTLMSLGPNLEGTGQERAWT